MAQPPESSTQASAGSETPLHTGPPELKLINTSEPQDVPKCKELMTFYQDLFEGHKVPLEDRPVAILIDSNKDFLSKIPVVLMVHWIPKQEECREPHHDMLNADTRQAIETLADHGTTFAFYINRTDCEIIFRFVLITDWKRLGERKDYNLKQLILGDSTEQFPINTQGYIRPARWPTDWAVNGSY